MRNWLTTILIAALLCLICFAAEAGRGGGGTGQKYAWASRSIDGGLWGMAQGDIDADGTIDTVLLERQRIRVGVLGGAGFDEAFSCRWSTAARAARVDLIDMDGDGVMEAAITAAEKGLPSSVVLAVDIAAGRCAELVANGRFSLRVIDYPEGSKLVGQGWSRAEFFSGPVREIELKGGRLKGGRRLNLPRGTNLYQFAPLPDMDGKPAVAIVKGRAHVEVTSNVRGRKWKRAWRSGEKLGGSANVLPAEQRPALDQISSNYATFDIPPLAVGPDLFAVKADMPARDMVGAVPYVRGGEVVELRPDPALTYVEGMRTQWLSGAVVDFRPGFVADSSNRMLLVLIQQNPSAFGKSLDAKVLGFDVLAYGPAADTPIKSPTVSPSR